MNTLQKMLVSFFIAGFLFVFLSACGNKEDDSNAQKSASVLIPSAPASTMPIIPEPSIEETPKPEAKVEVVQTVAYYFPSVDGFPTLYAGFEVENTGEHSIIIDEATVKFDTGKKSISENFSPMQNSDDVIFPGQKIAFALWLPYDKESKLTVDSPIKANVSLKASHAEDESASRLLTLSDIRLIQNYPKFPTLSCAVSSREDQRDFSLSLIYVSLYDENEKLLGVWHFIDNKSMPTGTRRNFVTQMKTLPIPDIAEKTKKLAGRAIGID